MIENPNLLKTGDIIHVQGQGIISRLIRRFSRGWGEEKTWSSHSAMVLRVRDEVEIIEALTRVTKRGVSAYSKKKAKLLASRKPGGLNAEENSDTIDKAEEYYGRTYGYLKLFAHVLDRLFNNRYSFRRLARMDDYPICSWLVAYVYDRSLKYQFGAPPNAVQPDDLLDHCVEANWDFIWSDSEDSASEFYRIYEFRPCTEKVDSRAS